MLLWDLISKLLQKKLAVEVKFNNHAKFSKFIHFCFLAPFHVSLQMHGGHHRYCTWRFDISRTGEVEQLLRLYSLKNCHNKLQHNSVWRFSLIPRKLCKFQLDVVDNEKIANPGCVNWPLPWHTSHLPDLPKVIYHHILDIYQRYIWGILGILWWMKHLWLEYLMRYINSGVIFLHIQNMSDTWPVSGECRAAFFAMNVG